MKRDRSVFALGLASGCLLTAALTTTAQTPASPRSALPVEELRVFAEAFGAMKSSYVEPVDDKKAISNCVAGMISGLDERSEFYDTEAFRELQVGSAGAGIGLELGMEFGLPKVVTAIEGTPASRADMRSGDILTRIDDQPLKGQTLSGVVKLLRGKPGTDVRLTVVRDGERSPREIVLRREPIRINPVRASMLEGGLAYVRVSSFAESAPARIAAELGKLYREQPGIKGVVLDLRNNPGGLLSSAVGISAAFLPEGALIGTTDGRTPDSKQRFAADAKSFLRGRERDFRPDLPRARETPVAVLVNRGSAAGTEFLAGALQDHKRAVIVGEKTYGRGSVQTILPFAEGRALKLTTAYWYRPNGARIEGSGVVPDVVVEGASAAPPAAPDPGKDAALARAVAALQP